MDILEEVEEERRRIDSEDVSSSGYCTISKHIHVHVDTLGHE